MGFKKEKREMKERPVSARQKNILPGAIMIALFVSVAIFMVMLNVEKNALADYEKGAIYTAIKAIPKGEMITEANFSSYFSPKEMDKKLVPETALALPEQVYGSMPIITIDAGSLITSGMFETVDEATGNMEQPVIAGFKAEDLYQVVSGTLRAGDRIHIYVIDEETKQATLAWQDICVQQVFDAAGAAIPSGDDISAAQRVNIFLEQDSTEQFYSVLTAGALRVVKAWD